MNNELIYKQAAIDEITEYGSGDTVYMSVVELKRRIEHLPSAQPELDIWNDGTLHISVSKGQLDKIGRVLAEENGTIFCKLFYQDAEPEPRTAYWTKDAVGSIVCSKCGGIREDNRIGHTNFCNCCGAKMRGERDANND